MKTITEKTGLGYNSCLKWRKRFQALGLDGLKDAVKGKIIRFVVNAAQEYRCVNDSNRRDDRSIGLVEEGSN